MSDGAWEKPCRRDDCRVEELHEEGTCDEHPVDDEVRFSKPKLVTTFWRARCSQCRAVFSFSADGVRPFGVVVCTYCRALLDVEHLRKEWLRTERKAR